MKGIILFCIFCLRIGASLENSVPSNMECLDTINQNSLSCKRGEKSLTNKKQKLQMQRKEQQKIIKEQLILQLNHLQFYFERGFYKNLNTTQFSDDTRLIVACFRDFFEFKNFSISECSREFVNGHMGEIMRFTKFIDSFHQQDYFEILDDYELYFLIPEQKNQNFDLLTLHFLFGYEKEIYQTEKNILDYFEDNTLIESSQNYLFHAFAQYAVPDAFKSLSWQYSQIEEMKLVIQLQILKKFKQKCSQLQAPNLDPIIESGLKYLENIQIEQKKHSYF